MEILLAICHNHKDQIHSGTIFIYDYNIDKDAKLKNLDGEVEGFEQITVNNLYKILEKKLLKSLTVLFQLLIFLRKMR